MRKLYHILLDKHEIGTTDFEKADAPMGVVSGKIMFIGISSGYDFFRDYCINNGLNFTDSPEDKLISTVDMPTLQVFDDSGNEIKGLSCSISGMDSEQFDIYIEGIEYPFYEMEFPHHVKFYNELRESK